MFITPNLQFFSLLPILKGPFDIWVLLFVQDAYMRQSTLMSYVLS